MIFLNFIIIIICLFIAGFISFLSVSIESLVFNDIPLIYYCISLSFLIHWIIFIPSYLNKTESSASLAVFRFFFGFLMCFSIVRSD